MMPAPVQPSLLASFFGALQVGAPIEAGDLVVVPLLGRGDALEVDLLEDALRSGRTTVTEVSEGGVVGLVRVKHGGERLLLLVDGEVVSGAKQTRTFNASFLVPPGATVDVPVSCVEQGRWRYDKHDFGSAETTLTSSMRASKVRRVAASIARDRGYDADQGAVWRDVETYIGSVHAPAPTRSFEDAHRTQTGRVAAHIDALEPLPDQVGHAVVRAGKLVSIDAFGSSRTYARAWRKLARGLLAETEEASHPDGSARAIVHAALAWVGAVPLVQKDAPGAGESLHGVAGQLAVGAITHGGHVVHATLVG